MPSKFLKRLSYLDHLIYAKQTGSPENLAAKLNLSISATFEYIKALKEFGAPIKYDRIRKSYFYDDNGRFLFYFNNKNWDSIITGVKLHILHQNKVMKAFCCYKCNTKFGFSKALLLSENSVIKCENCGAFNYPVGLTNGYFKFSFIITFVPGITIAFYFKNLIAGLTTSLCFGIIGYLISVVYTYRKTFFSQIK